MLKLLFALLLVVATSGCYSWREQVRDQGRRAFKAGVPAHANPHRAGAGEEWLEGWLEAKAKSDVNER